MANPKYVPMTNYVIFAFGINRGNLSCHDKPLQNVFLGPDDL